MNKFVKQIIEKLNLKYNLEVQRQKIFFSKPDVLLSFNISSLSFLNSLSLFNKSKKEVLNFLRSNTQA